MPASAANAAVLELSVSCMLASAEPAGSWRGPGSLEPRTSAVPWEFADEATGEGSRCCWVVGEGRPLWAIDDDDPRREDTGDEPFRATAAPLELEAVAAAVALEAVGLAFALLTIAD